MEPTPELLLAAYTQGYFPMAESRDAQEVRWMQPELRGVIPLDDFHVPRSLAKFMKKSPFTFTADAAFETVIRACAERDETWINDKIVALYCELHARGFAHSIECWKPTNSLPPCGGGLGRGGTINDPERGDSPLSPPSPTRGEGKEGSGFTLAGGLYGVSIGGAFFGESMFSRESNASKCALVELIRRLREMGYMLLDAQYTNEHLTQFGITEIPHESYMQQLAMALKVRIANGWN